MSFDDIRTMAADLAAAGAPTAFIEEQVRLARGGHPDAYEVHRDNVTAVRLYMAMRTQWNAVGLSTMQSASIARIGLRYEVIPFVAEQEGLALEAGDTLVRLRIMEAEALVCQAERLARAS